MRWTKSSGRNFSLTSTVRCRGVESVLALRHDTHFMAAKVSTTLRLLTLIMPMPG